MSTDASSRWFHSLEEFDDVKRSCRKHLDGHNRRRKKPQPSSLFMAAEKFLYNYKAIAVWFKCHDKASDLS
ncbi:hypothetical protein RIF29_19950 [Crotalaria pallida]|uniref:SBP-type domain-containing protein n=1 Tax=Crotalaria pallida TaxID=3830 RepID=A0AAN9F4L0_CROPI